MKLDIHTNLPLLAGLFAGGYIALSVSVSVAPATWVSAHNAPLPGSAPLTAEQQAGLRVYISEGCAYCHTQQVRPLPEDSLFGRPSAPGDFARLVPLGGFVQVPEVLGTERTGPDLSAIGTRQPSDVWQYIHLYQPRALVSASIMPAFPWLFRVVRTTDSQHPRVPVPAAFVPDDLTVVATPRAKALVAYLLSLKQTPIAGMANAPPAPATGGATSDAAGASVYAARCASCHQPAGTGVPGAFPPLTGDPVVNGPAAAHLAVVLNGLHGKSIAGVAYAGAMPPWGALLSDAEIMAVVNHERASWGNHAPPVTAADVATARHQPAAP